MENTKIPEISIDSKLLYQRLSTMKPGEFIPYEELSGIIGRNVQKDGYGYLKTAREMAQREDKIAFGVVVDRGLRCLQDAEIVNTMQPAIERVRRMSRKALKRIGCIADLNALSNTDRISLHAKASILGVLATVTKEASIRKIENKVSETNQRLAFVKTLEAFSNGGGSKESSKGA